MRDFGISPLFPLTPSLLETSRDTLHPGTKGGYDSGLTALRGRVRGLGLREAV